MTKITSPLRRITKIAIVKNKKYLFFAAKFLIVGGILYYLISSKKLDVSSFQIYIKDPLLLMTNIAVWFFGSTLLTTYRWHLLLKGMNVHLPFKKVLHLNFVGFFFNTIAPGAVGGDFVKGYYLFRDQTEGNRTSAMLAIFLDRVVGLYCVFFMATIAILSSYSRFVGSTILSSIAYGAVLGFLGMTLVFLILFLASKPIEANFLFRFLQRPYPGFSFLQKIFLSLFILKERPSYFLKSVCTGLLFQIMYISLYGFVTLRMGFEFSIPDFAAIFPVGFLASALPIAPGGLGVGHLVFDQLFAIIGIAHGANIYNCVFLSQTSLNLLGFIPYVFLKKGSARVIPSVPFSS